jgi:hypothetical protein
MSHHTTDDECLMTKQKANSNANSIANSWLRDSHELAMSHHTTDDECLMTKQKASSNARAPVHTAYQKPEQNSHFVPYDPNRMADLPLHSKKINYNLTSCLTRIWHPGVFNFWPCTTLQLVLLLPPLPLILKRKR